MRKRMRLKPDEVNFLGLEVKTSNYTTGDNPLYILDDSQQSMLNELRGKTKVASFTRTSANNYSKKGKKVVLSSWDYKTNKNMGIEEYCKKYNFPIDDITSYKLVSHTGTPFYNIVFKTISEKIKEDLTEEFISNAIKQFIVPAKLRNPINSDDFGRQSFDRLIFTDAHIGMDTNKDGNALYPVKWGEQELMARMEEMVDRTRLCKTSRMLIVDDLGDLLDGWDAQTVRKGHHLPQNMDNKKAFDVALKFKVEMAQMLAEEYDFIQFNNICEDNHSGAFGYIVNSAFKTIIEAQYENRIVVRNHEAFINHYTVFNNHFVITHGKDSKNLKFGFKPHLDPKQIEKIDQYMKYNSLYDGKDIEFSKGDSHQLLLDMASSDDFDYMNYLAFSPSSEWVQTNFKKGRSGFVLQHFNNGNRVINPVFFK